MRDLAVRGRAAIGPALDAYVVAEIGTNHNRSLNTAKALIQALAGTGCDCVKFQIYEPDEIVSGRIRAADYGLDAQYGDISAREMFERHLKTPKEWFPELRGLCHSLGMDCAATIHGGNGLNWALETKLDLIKIASMDHNNQPLLSSLVNVVGVPLLVSVGMAGLRDIDAAVETTRRHEPGIGLFHCCALYPAEPDELRLSNIPFLLRRYSVPVGFSDHALGAAPALQARAAGAMMFEKHVTLDRTQPGPDHGFAMEMQAFTEYVAALKRTSRGGAAPSAPFLDPVERELQNRTQYVKSIITRRPLGPGHVLTMDDVYLARPGSGLAPDQLPLIVGRTVARAVPPETPLQWDHLASGSADPADQRHA
jgi:sialic acid synthase SpsE